MGHAPLEHHRIIMASEQDRKGRKSNRPEDDEEAKFEPSKTLKAACVDSINTV